MAIVMVRKVRIFCKECKNQNELMGEMIETLSCEDCHEFICPTCGKCVCGQKT